MSNNQNEFTVEANRPDDHYWGDLWRYRELFVVLAWRDIAVRYKQSLVGIAWAILRPLITITIFTVVFGMLAKLPSEGKTPYSVLVFIGMLPWFLFSNIVSEASNSLINNAGLITKVYFPRMILPASSCAVALIDFGVNLLFLFAVMVWYGIVPGINIIFLPLFVCLAIFVSLGPALLITALNLKYRDFRYLVPFALQVGLYVSPVGFASSALPEKWRILFSLNPMVSVIDGFRWCLLAGESQLYVPGFLLSLLIGISIFCFGLVYFRKTEDSFADLV